MFKKILVWVVSIWGFFSTAYGQDLNKGLCFYLPCEQSMEARLTEGTVVPRETIVLSYEKGVKGDGLVIGGLQSLSYRLKNNAVLFKAGTISLWIKPNYDVVKFLAEGKLFSSQHKASFFQNIAGIRSPVELSARMGFSGGKYFEEVCTAPKCSRQHARYKYEFFWRKGEWLHMVATWSTELEEMEFYLNGEKTGGRSDPSPWNIAESPAQEGATIMLGGGEFSPRVEEKQPLPDNFTYTIDEVRIYDRAMEPEDVQELFRTKN